MINRGLSSESLGLSQVVVVGELRLFVGYSEDGSAISMPNTTSNEPMDSDQIFSKYLRELFSVLYIAARKKGRRGKKGEKLR